jgi:hypothetical protein
MPVVGKSVVAGSVVTGTVVTGTVVAGTVVAGSVVTGAVDDGACVVATVELGSSVAGGCADPSEPHELATTRTNTSVNGQTFTFITASSHRRLSTLTVRRVGTPSQGRSARFGRPGEGGEVGEFGSD